MAYNDKEASRFVTEMSERQISAREFFSVGLLDALQRDFGLERAAIFIYNTEGQFLSWIRKNGMEVAGADHAYSRILRYDKMRKTMYEEAVADGLTYFNQNPRMYRASDFYAKNTYDKSSFVRLIEKEFGAHYCLSLAFGINAYIQIAFFKTKEEGDFSDAEVESFQEIYRYIATSYVGFKKHEQAKIISNIQDEIISSGEHAYLITDDFMHIIGYNREAVRLLVSVLGQSAAEEIEHHARCLWLPFLLDGQAGQVEGDRVVIKEIKNCVFKIYTYDQSYSHGIVDRYHWITISRKDPVEEKNHKEEIALTPAEQKVAELLCKGFTYQKVADELCISYHTVKNHVQNIFSKYHVNNRYELYEVLK